MTMRIIKKRSWWWAYPDPESPLEYQIIGEVMDKFAPNYPVKEWLIGNAAGAWRYSDAIVRLDGDSREFIAIRFQLEADAILFKIRFANFR